MMAVKVIIERSMSPDRHGEVVELLTELRAKAVRQPGYVSGETLFSIENPGKHVVLSTWESLNDWKDWEKNPQRVEIVDSIEVLLNSPSKVSAYETARFVAEGV